MDEFRRLAGVKILLVDDTPANIDVLSRTLENQGCETLAAVSGEFALKILEKTAPDLILLDIMMQGIDGFETCRRIKGREATSKIPIIFISAKDDADSIVKGFKLGATDYIIKPFCPEEVIVRVQTHLRLKKAEEKVVELTREVDELKKKLGAVDS